MNLFKQNRSSELLQIDFHKSWWAILWQQKYILFLISIGEISNNIFSTLIPLTFGTILASQNIKLLFILFFFWIAASIVQYLARSTSAWLQLRIIHSVHASAHERFLQVDPIYHTHRSSGTILAKIDRGARGYENLLDALVFELLSIISGVTTVIISIMRYSFTLGFIILFILCALSALIIYLARTIIRPLEKEWIKADDRVKAISTENLAQFQLVRSSFASNEMDDRLKKSDINMIIQEGKLWITHGRIYTFVKIIYIATIFIIAFYVLSLIKINEISIAVGIGLLLTYMQGTKEILRFDKPVREIIKYTARIKDLFNYIEKFGKQSFPVLEDRSCSVELPLCTENSTITIEAHNLFFDYHSKAKIFDGHTLKLSIPCPQPFKLYGIIGPSGIGKSTLMMILGGQLKPTSGEVTIAGINIYKTNDNIRRKLIALQGQVATSLRGTLRYNLLFGIPEQESYYTDDHLIAILKRVGIWALFEAKEGLNTFIGESGLTLSGGQRQRLNFANLYLRAQYFKPLLILIDEPTSSLDEVSEQAITDMIIELSRSAVTIVIAHRIKTLEKAVGILDCSLLSYEKDIEFYNKEALFEHSNYYNKLVYGKISLDD